MNKKSQTKCLRGIELIKHKLAEGNQSLLYLVVSGSHAWGLEKPDSDIDLRGIYQEPTINILGLHKIRDTVEFTDGDYDVQLYELEKFLNLLCNHNGNMVNLLWLPNPLVSTPAIPWTELSKLFMTRKLRFYYRGYADSQRKRAMSQRGGKALIYTYREIFSGLFAMHYGYMEHSFKKLWDEAKKQNWYNGGLLDKYFPDPAQEVTDEGWRQFYAEWEELCIKLDNEAAISPLSGTFDGFNMCDRILKQRRLLALSPPYDEVFLK